MVRLAIIAALTLLLRPAAASADLRIVASPGGEVGQYVKLFALVRESGERVVIDGPCFSACTLVLSIVPSDRICVTQRAVLGFHAARWVDRKGRQYAAAEETRLLAATYPRAVRNWIGRQGGLSSKPLFLRGRELASILPRCA
jgi:hypothetical protein